jgi:methylphosphotriester-DNA--protein-cysteine methyltransferase
MGKTYGKCRLCKSEKFLNYAGLCKRCNQKAVSSEIKEEVIEKQQKALETQKERQEKEEIVEKQVLEEKDEETAGEKKSDEKDSINEKS